MNSSSALAFSPATATAVRPPTSVDCISASAAGPSVFKLSFFLPRSLSAIQFRGRYASSPASPRRTSSRMKIRCDVAVKSEADINADTDPSSSSSSETEIGAEGKAKVGARVRVKVPLKVYHVVRVPEVELQGLEGVIKDYVAVWKGREVSANLPYKVAFVKEIEGRGLVKFFAHLKEDEFEFIDQ